MLQFVSILVLIVVIPFMVVGIVFYIAVEALIEWVFCRSQKRPREHD